MFRCNVLPLVLSASFIFLRHVVSSQVCANGNLAMPNLKELVIGKCLEYQSRINPGAFCNQRWVDFNMSLRMGKATIWFPNRSDTNKALQAQKIIEEEKLYYPCSENKGADHLCS